MEQANWVYVDWDQYLAEMAQPPVREVRVDWFIAWSWFAIGAFVGAFWLTVAFVIWGKW